MLEEAGDLIWYLTQYSKETNSSEILKEELETHSLIEMRTKKENLDMFSFKLSKILMKNALSLVSKNPNYKKEFCNIMLVISTLISIYEIIPLAEIFETNIEKLSKRYKERVNYHHLNRGGVFLGHLDKKK